MDAKRGNPDRLQGDRHESQWSIQRGPNCLIVRLNEQRTLNDRTEQLANRLLSTLAQHSTNRVVVEVIESEEPRDEIFDVLCRVRDDVTSRGGSLKVIGPRWSESSKNSLVPVYPDLRTALLPPRG